MVNMFRLAPLVLLLLLGCGNPSGILNVRGPIAAHIAELWWLLLFLALGVFMPVIGLLLYALFHPRRDDKPQAHQDLENRLVIGGGIVMPILVLTFVFVLTVRSTVELSASPPSDLTIRVTGHQWWWQVQYPEYGFETALTHFASRRTLAASTLKNTRENLARWILDPDKIKRDSGMPPTALNDADLQALLSYLESLQ